MSRKFIPEEWYQGRDICCYESVLLSILCDMSILSPRPTMEKKTYVHQYFVHPCTLGEKKKKNTHAAELGVLCRTLCGGCGKDQFTSLGVHVRLVTPADNAGP